ncbi:hypothetical protein ARMSODRAFT_1022896 [Armillaria solidipes]|uniref:F-box domain-containing protein n=1 Tax=Armillaria solidipes TaxID=1076256 RepID=A0A2H3B158_9AGAR|nr:hypothetical protein ARMSODRAFT_1022896 [Armillaria solidipes]
MHILLRRRSQAPTGILLSLPVELLEHILHESCNTGRKALRSTCTHLCRLVTPFVFETLVIDIAKTSLSNSRDRLRFFTALVSGKTLARHVRHLRLVSLMIPVRNRLGILDRVFFNKREDKKSKKMETLLAAAIPLMTSLQSVKYDGTDAELLESVALSKQLSYIPCMSVVLINNRRSAIPRINLDFLHIAELSILGPWYLDFTATLISNNTRLASVGLYSHSYSSDPASTAILEHPKGMYRCITNLSLCGKWALRRSNVPILVPKLRQLRSLELCIEFVASEFWAALQAEQICIQQVSLSLSDNDPALFDYLCSYSGLHSLFLRIRSGFVEETRKGMERVRERHGKLVDCEPPGLQFAPYDVEDFS